MPNPTYLVTGGAGFIGSAFVLACRQGGIRVINLDKLTYAGNLENLSALQDDTDHVFIRGDIGDHELVREILREYQPDAVVNLAAESHVDRSIVAPESFMLTNVMGTFHLLEAALEYWKNAWRGRNGRFIFLHVSTDEVFGSLAPDEPPFSETTPYAPSSPYAASKAASDHLARSYHSTYGLPVIVTNCSNNYGPRQFPEKLIPLMILRAQKGESLPVYGDGLNIRDWLYVDDHCRALLTVLKKGRDGETYNIGGNCEKTNLDIVGAVCDRLDLILPDAAFTPRRSLITHVTDRPGHDRRYAVDCRKITTELGWRPLETMATGLARTIDWYLRNSGWVASVHSGEYRQWLELNYAKR